MTNPTRGPASATSEIREFREIHQRIDHVQGLIDGALTALRAAVNQTLDQATAQLGDLPARVARLEDLVRPLTVDPADPDVEWCYRRSDGILRPAPTDQNERAAMIAAGVRLFPVINREDGRVAFLPPPQMATP